MTFRGTILVGSTLDYRVICKWPDVWTDQNYHTNDRPQYVTYIFPFRYIKILFARTIYLRASRLYVFSLRSWKDVVLLGERNRHFVLPEGRKSHCGYRLFSNIVHTKYEIWRNWYCNPMTSSLVKYSTFYFFGGFFYARNAAVAALIMTLLLTAIL